MPRALAIALGLARHPRRTLRALAAAPPAGPTALLPVLLLGGLYALLLGLLAAGGHQPSVARGLPVAAERYYAVAAIYVAPLFVGLWLLFAALADRLAGGGRAAATRAVLAYTYALPFAALFVVPDLVVYGLAGHAGLGRWLPLYAPLAPLAVVLLTAEALRALHGVGRGRALAASVGAFVLQAVPMALLIR